MTDEWLSCYKWTREPDAHTGPAVDYWNTYPGAAEEYETHEVTIVYWPNPTENSDD
jgi:hypothetical protein